VGISPGLGSKGNSVLDANVRVPLPVLCSQLAADRSSELSCHYFPPRPWLPSQPYQSVLLGNRGTWVRTIRPQLLRSPAPPPAPPGSQTGNYWVASPTPYAPPVAEASFSHSTSRETVSAS